MSLLRAEGAPRFPGWTRQTSLMILLSTALVSALGCSTSEPPTRASVDERTGDDDSDADDARPTSSGSKKSSDGGTKSVGATSQACPSIRHDAPAARGAVDVVFLIDTSGSMWDDFAQIQKNLTSFTQSLESSHADIRVVMVTGSNPAAGSALGMDITRYRFVASPVESHMLYTIALLTLPTYRDFLRPDAATHFVMVTDDQDLLSAAIFRTEMEKALGRKFTVHAIASEEVDGRPCASAACGGVWLPLVCGAVAVGEAYNTLAEQTGGGKISICSDDWTSVLENLGDAVIAAVPLPCSYPLEAVAGNQADPERVQVVYTPEGGRDEEFPKADDEAQCGDAEGWHFDRAVDPRNVVLCPAACETVQKGGSIDIALGCRPTTVI